MPSSDVRVGRYALLGEIASGGMATVHYGRQRGAAGFARIVAIKRLHPHLAKNEDFRTMLLDEARIAARVRHPNVAAMIDVVEAGDEVLLVMDYIAGESLSRLLRRSRERGEQVPTDVAIAIMCDMLHGLHAAHEAKSERGEPLGIVHRDVSPQNVLVGSDGIARLVDFGIAKATGRVQETRDGQVKGKLAYMAPEQLQGKAIDRRCDIYAAGVVLWEMLVGHRLFLGDSEAETVTNVLSATVTRPSEVAPWVPAEIDQVVMRAIQRDPAARFATARDMATALEAAFDTGTARTVSAWVQSIAGDVLAKRANMVAELERDPDTNAYDRPSLQPSPQYSITVEAEEPRSPVRRWVIVAAVSGLAFAVGAGLTFSTRREASTPKPPPEVASVVASSVIATDTASSTTEAPPPTASVTASAVSAVASVEAAPTRTAPSHGVTHVVTTTAAPSASAPCIVKTYTDADGIIRFRNECGGHP